MATLTELQELFSNRSAISVAIEINGFTGFRTTHMEDLTEDEINRLYAIHCPKEVSATEQFEALQEELISKAWKSKILVAAEQAKLKDPGNFHRFNNWMLLKSKFKKHLNAHTIEELKELHAQIRAAIANNARSAQKPLTKAWWKKAENLKEFN